MSKLEVKFSADGQSLQPWIANTGNAILKSSDVSPSYCWRSLDRTV